MSVEEQIAKLVDRYEGLGARRLKQFNEENTKKDFILPLFRHLGWDVTNSDEVAAEEKSSNGRVDYAFKIGGVSKFYLEAKPLREDLNQRPDWAKQVITYAENKGVTWAVLTNFKQLMVFNAEWDKPALERARFLNLTYQEYLPAFHKLWWLSRDSIEKGILDEEARQVGALKPKLPVEKSLLDQLLRWREGLFNQIYQHNKDKGLDSYQQVDELIQQFINRLIFIRSAEDRGIEENRLRAALHQWRDSERKGELVESVRAIFHEFATLYDSDLFPPLDTWDSVFVESDTIEKIIEGSYERPTRLAGYDFAAIDPKVWGAIYEQYLGYVTQVAREEAKKRATQARLLGFEAPAFELEARRIKRKQQGIYYTPEFVVDYIVKETVGRFLKEHSHNDIFNIKILDPACGSGSFLIRAYDELLHYHASQQGKSPAELDHSERRRILLGNIFGVDLDRQAVEITRLSLLLSCVARREILPSLKDNIREGNSLISGTDEELKKYFGDEWRDKKRLNWEEEFKDIMANGGFDVVIGNPPWVSLKGKFGVSGFAEDEISYLTEKYRGDTYRPNIVEYFIKRSLTLLKDGGFHSFIIPDRVFANLQFEDLRTEILQNCKIHSLVYRVPFPGTVADAAIYVVQKVKSPKHWKVNTCEWEKTAMVIPQAFYLKSPDHSFAFLGDQKLATVMGKLEKSQSLPLGTIFNSNVGFIAGRGKVTSKPTSQDDMVVYKGENVLRYAIRGQSYFIFTKSNLVGGTQDKAKLGIEEKILLRKTGDRISATLDKSGNFPEQSLYFLYKSEYKQYDIRYVLALLNSCLLNCYYINRLATNRDTMPQLKKIHLDRFPIRRIDFSNPAEKKMHDDLVALADRMLELNKRLAPIRNTSLGERDELLREIERTDTEIDQKVYELYGLTEEERQVIEASLASKS